MNKSEKSDKDILDRYIKPEKIEKAPEGFTEKLMTRIQLEEVSYSVIGLSFKKIKVPIISVLITATLTVSAILGPAPDKDSVIFPILKPLSDLRINFPEIDFNILKGIVLPGWMIYVAIGIFMLAIFDRVLNRFFQRDRK
jgi:hypothetical protein